MIYGVFGLPGTGKSCYLSNVAHRRSTRRKYERVYSNYPIEGCYTLNTDWLGVYNYSNCLVLIDEISLVFDSRDYRNFPAHTKQFFALSRHYKCDIIYCSQSYEDCDKRIRNITDSVYQITQSIIPGFSRVRRIVKTMSCSDGLIKESYELSGLGRFIYRPRQYRYFDSFTAPELLDNCEQLWDFTDSDKK